MPRRRAAYAGLALLVVLLLTEGVLRALVPEEALVFSYERPNGYLLASGTGTYLPRPGARAVLPDGPNYWHYAMNAEGLRESQEIAADKPPGTRRYLVLGDSWAWGHTGDQTATIDRGLEALLSARLGAPVEAINGGVPGAGAYDMLVRWRTLRDRYAVDAVILGIPHNLGRQASVAAERDLWYAGGAPYAPSYVYLGLRRLVLPFTRAKLRERDEDDWTQVIEDLGKLVAEATERGLPVTLGLWPQNREAALSGRPAIPYARIVQALPGAAVTGIRLADNACWGFQDHGHPSEAGYFAVATVLAERALGGPDPGRLRGDPRCQDNAGIGPTKGVPPRTKEEAERLLAAESGG